MEKVVCVSSAKVPIVKIWDPELKLACDMNVNNTLALENTRMVRTYVEIDERVRPLAMIIKYWTRRRIVNDAGETHILLISSRNVIAYTTLAFGGTLSSYTWICLIIAFLQLREPPVVPALHQRPRDKLPKDGGPKSAFADDLDKLRGFGTKNKDGLATLLFQFFRFYAHEFDYEKHALSIRLGKLLTKTEKKWHLGTNNMLCVEEPFNTVRNLGNTADDFSFRGLHEELRRAFDLIADGKLDECCEQYVFPKEEERTFHKPPSQPRPILVRSSSQQYSGRGGRGGYRGNRQYRNGGSNRRASSSVTSGFDTNGVLPPTGMYTAPLLPQNYLWYQANPQLHPELFANSINALTAQQQLFFPHMLPVDQVALARQVQRLQVGSAQATDRPRTNSFDNPPLSAPAVQAEHGYRVPTIPLSEPYFHPGYGTYPSSPAAATTEFRRSLHRGTVASDSGGSAGSGALRSQSQPASRTPMGATQPLGGYPAPVPPSAPTSQPRHVNGVPIPSFMPDEAADSEFDDAPTKGISDSPPEEDGPRFIGYYVNESSSPVRKVNGFPSAVPTFGDLHQVGQGRRRLSTDQLPQSILDRRMKRTSRSPSPLGHARAFSVGTNSAPLTSAPFQVNGKLTPNRAPPVVNGSIPKTSPSPGGVRPPPPSVEPLPVEDASYDNPLYITQGHGFGNPWGEQSMIHPPSTGAPSPPTYPERPVIVNGSSSGRSPITPQSLAEAPFQQRVAVGVGMPNGLPYLPLLGDMNGIPAVLTSSSIGRPRVISRQQQNGIAPLDLATGEFTVAQDIQQHLSPVYEHRTPSPTAVRRFEAPTSVQHPPAAAPLKESRPEASRAIQKSPSMGTTTTKHDSVGRSPVDPRPNGIARENGHVRGAKSQNDSTSVWQKQKIRKKGIVELKGASNGFPHGEQPPKNDADRKGG